jgi:hypothetical protein
MFAFQRKLDATTLENLFAKFKSQVASKDKSWMSRIFSGLRRKDDKAGTLPASFSVGSEKEKRSGSLPSGANAGASMVPSPSAPSLLGATKAPAVDSSNASDLFDDDDDEDSGSGVDKHGNKVFYTKSLTPSSEQLVRGSENPSIK